MFSHCGWLGCALNRRDAHEQLQQQLSGLQDELKEIKRDRRERLAVPSESQVQPTPETFAEPRREPRRATRPPTARRESVAETTAPAAPPEVEVVEVVPNPNPNPSDARADATETAASIERSKSHLPERHAAFFLGEVRANEMCIATILYSICQLEFCLRNLELQLKCCCDCCACHVVMLLQPARLSPLTSSKATVGTLISASWHHHSLSLTYIVSLVSLVCCALTGRE